MTQIFTKQEIEDILTKNNDIAELALEEMRRQRAHLKQETFLKTKSFAF